MNDIDKIIYEIFIIRNSLISVQEYIFKKELINSFYTTFTQSTKHILEIYKDRLEFSKITEENYIGLDLTVDMLQNTELDEVRISTLEGVEASCTIFSSENYSIIIGIIFTKIPISWICNP